MRGSGKSYYGKRIAKLLGWKFIDTDDLIKTRTNSTITEIVQKNGWKHFRDLERDIAKEVSQLDEHVISTGGGMIIDRENEQELKKNGKIIFLYRTIEKCMEFMEKGHNKDRPPLENEIADIWIQREKRYTQSADLIVNVTEEVTPAHIIELLESV